MRKKRRPPVVIPQPKVRPGDTVNVENYRMRPPQWERGHCIRAKFGVDHTGRAGRWAYDIMLVRCSDKCGMALWLYVNNDGVESTT